VAVLSQVFSRLLDFMLLLNRFFSPSFYHRIVTINGRGL
jgi:hypothetical protein